MPHQFWYDSIHEVEIWCEFHPDNIVVLSVGYETNKRNGNMIVHLACSGGIIEVTGRASITEWLHLMISASKLDITQVTRMSLRGHRIRANVRTLFNEPYAGFKI